MAAPIFPNERKKRNEPEASATGKSPALTLPARCVAASGLTFAGDETAHFLGAWTAIVLADDVLHSVADF